MNDLQIILDVRTPLNKEQVAEKCLPDLLNHLYGLLAYTGAYVTGGIVRHNPALAKPVLGVGDYVAPQPKK